MKKYPNYPGKRGTGELEGETFIPGWTTWSYGWLWKIGEEISGGSGFWGSGSLFDHPRPQIVVKAWFDALREKGYSPADAVLYGDWTDGRHIADNIYPNMGYAEIKRHVKKNARSAAEVHEENQSYWKEPQTKMTLELWFSPAHEEQMMEKYPQFREE